MNIRTIWTSILTAIATIAAVGAVAADAPKMKMTTDIPESITTPASVETRIGTLRFFDGYPDDATTQLVYDNLDFMRGVETFLNGMPATSIEALRRGQAELGATEYNHVVIFDDLMDSDPIFLTGNTDTVYALAFFDLNRDGPIVVEVPSGSGPGTVNDAFRDIVVIAFVIRLCFSSNGKFHFPFKNHSPLSAVFVLGNFSDRFNFEKYNLLVFSL